MHSQNKPVVIYDGHCNFCDGFIQFIIKNIRKDVDIFYAFQKGKSAQKLLSTYKLNLTEETIFYIDISGNLFTKSDAVIEVFKNLNKPYFYLSKISYLPKLLRDIGYSYFSRYRYKIFGKKNTCDIPSSNQLKNFLE